MTAELRAEELRSEEQKMRRVLGIVFTDGTFGRVPRIAGTGIEVFEIIKSYEVMAHSWGRLRTAYHWLTAEQLRAALAYAHAYPDEVASRLRMEDEAAARLGGYPAS